MTALHIQLIHYRVEKLLPSATGKDTVLLSDFHMADSTKYSQKINLYDNEIRMQHGNSSFEKSNTVKENKIKCIARQNSAHCRQ